MNSIGSDRANEGPAAKRLFVMHTAPSHPLSAPDPHLTLKLRRSDLQNPPSEDTEEHEQTES